MVEYDQLGDSVSFVTKPTGVGVGWHCKGICKLGVLLLLLYPLWVTGIRPALVH